MAKRGGAPSTPFTSGFLGNTVTSDFLTSRAQMLGLERRRRERVTRRSHRIVGIEGELTRS